MRQELKEEISNLEKELEEKLKIIDKKNHKKMRLAYIIGGFIIIIVHCYLYNISIFD